MHPVIRISIFFIFTFFIVQAKPGQLLLTGFILFGASYFQPRKITVLMLNMIWRLKWFYISIFILFSLFTPNEIGSFSELSNQQFDGIISVFYYPFIKIAALVLIVMSVMVLIVSIPKQELIASLIYLSKPLSIFGFSSERFAVRVYLIIEFVEILPTLINTSLEHGQSENNINFKIKIKQIVFRLCHVVNKVYTLAESAECKIVHYEKMKLPDLYQWSYLLICIGLFYCSDILINQIIV